MSFAVVASRALDGVHAPPVQVEVHLANGLPSFTLVGLADTEVKEARERVRSALTHSGLGFPHNKRITVNLAPADLPKESGRFDLPIALGILAADERLDASLLARHEFAGELSLAGELRPVRGALALALAVQREAKRLQTPARTLVLPQANARDAARVQTLDVRRAEHLSEVVESLQVLKDEAQHRPSLPRVQPDAQGLNSADPASAARVPDLAEVRGQAAAKFALEVAAAGGHSLLFCGPPGAGKSMLAQRLVGLLPPMDEELALTSAAVASLAGTPDSGGAAWRLRPYRAPHHSASAVALVGGGSPPRPGEISLAHGGVLFLDELPEFSRHALESLREPLERGCITISRAARQATFPARFQLIAAMNPCPCGWFGAPNNTRLAPSLRQCRCSPDIVARYQARISGPWLDRIDLHVDVPALQADALLGQRSATAPDAVPTESSATVAARVAQARARQSARQGCTNAELELTQPAHEQALQMDDEARRLLQQAAERLGWSGRALHRTMRVARTVADLQASPTVQAMHLAQALHYRPSMDRALGGPSP